MEIATILFTYNRPNHTAKVLDALKKNDVLPRKLIIFQDGPKASTDLEAWKEVGRIISQATWCDTEVHISGENRGLAESVVSGVTYAMKNHEAVIVLEDDCVPHPKFMSYMISGLTKFKDTEQVYSVEGGETWPIHLHKGSEDAFFCGRISSYGWGTWKNRWEQYERDYTLLKKIRDDPEARERLSIWGGDLEAQLIGNITGKCDSWAVFWALKVIQKGGYCLRPYKSLIKNIGYDGTGIHSGEMILDMVCRDEDNLNDIMLPDTIQYNEECKAIYKLLLQTVPANEKLNFYQNILSAWITLKQKGKKILNPSQEQLPVAIWGKGCLCDLLLQEWEGNMRVEAIIESIPTVQQYHGIPVISPDMIPSCIKTIIVMPVYAMEQIQHKTGKKQINVIGIDELIEVSLKE